MVFVMADTKAILEQLNKNSSNLRVDVVTEDNQVTNDKNQSVVESSVMSPDILLDCLIRKDGPKNTPL